MHIYHRIALFLTLISATVPAYSAERELTPVELRENQVLRNKVAMISVAPLFGITHILGTLQAPYDMPASLKNLSLKLPQYQPLLKRFTCIAGATYLVTLLRYAHNKRLEIAELRKVSKKNTTQ